MSVRRRCGCRDPDTGKQLGAACPLLANPRHGSWEYSFDVASVDGKRLQKRKGGFVRKKDAEAAERDVQVHVATGGRVQRGAGRMTVETYLRQWLKDKERDGARPKTIEGYTFHVERVLIPRLGRVKLADLDAGHVEEALRGYRTAYEKRYGPMRPTTVERVRATLRSSLTDARRQGYIRGNPAADAIVPKGTRPRIHPLEPDELGKLLDHTASDRLGPLFETMALVGLRRGEALGLRWSDIDVERRELVVRQQLIQVGRELLFTPPKTDAGEGRRVPLPESAVGSLLTHKLDQEVERELWADGYQDAGLVFAQEDGKSYSPWWITLRFRELCAEAGVRRVRLHDLRHGAASLHLAAGTPVEVVSKLLGHSSIAITVDTYQHLLGDLGSRAAEAVSALVPRRKTTPNPDREHRVITNSTQGA